ncbi:MAG: hypothetical protein A2177_15590 [Spirochaetes bacterium RBG_13_68_11]|nr:MAG: hypothetical protein A2177_15590 [Spirochaetes bacterium RBG_13_68_11]
MSRSIETDRSSFLEVLLKLIPSEVIAVHVFIQGVMPRVFWPTFVVFLLLVGITPLYLYWAMGVRSRPQLTVSTLSLVVWIYALGQGPFRFMRAPWWEPWYGSVLLALWTLVPPMFLTRTEPQPAPRVAPKIRTRKR